MIKLSKGEKCTIGIVTQRDRALQCSVRAPPSPNNNNTLYLAVEERILKYKINRPTCNVMLKLKIKPNALCTTRRNLKDQHNILVDLDHECVFTIKIKYFECF